MQSPPATVVTIEATAEPTTHSTAPGTKEQLTTTATCRGLTDTVPAWHARFLTLLPDITLYARVCLKHLRGDHYDEVLQEVIANATVQYARLVEHGREHVATVGSLARFAVRQVRSGRKVGTPLNVQDVSSPYCQHRKHVDVHRLDVYDQQDEQWRELIPVEDHKTPVPDQAAFRIDFPRWLRTLSRRDRKVAFRLARSECTQVVARMFGISPGRVSQLRRELAQSWQDFHTGGQREGRRKNEDAGLRDLAGAA